MTESTYHICRMTHLCTTLSCSLSILASINRNIAISSRFLPRYVDLIFLELWLTALVVLVVLAGQEWKFELEVLLFVVWVGEEVIALGFSERLGVDSC